MERYKIVIQHEKYGKIVDQVFKNKVQFKLFLESINGSYHNNSRSLFFNGEDFISHIPAKVLDESVVTTKVMRETENLVEYVQERSKMESLVDVEKD